MLQLLDFNENPNVGVFCRANDDIIFIPKGLLKKVKKKIIEALDVELVALYLDEDLDIEHLGGWRAIPRGARRLGGSSTIIWNLIISFDSVVVGGPIC